MLKFVRVTVETECSLCGKKEIYDESLQTQLDMGETDVYFENEPVCRQCGFPSLNEDNEVYCDDDESDNYDDYVTPSDCEDCPLFDGCDSSAKAMYPQAFPVPE
jgi:hypothetical protein